MIKLDGNTKYIAILQFSIIIIHQNTLHCSTTIIMIHLSVSSLNILISQSRNTEYNRTISIDIMSPMVKPSYLHLLMYQLIVVLHWVHLDSTILDTKHQLCIQSPPQLNIPKTAAYTSYTVIQRTPHTKIKFISPSKIIILFILLSCQCFQCLIPQTMVLISNKRLLLYMFCVDVYCCILSIYLLFHRLNHPTQLDMLLV